MPRKRRTFGPERSDDPAETEDELENETEDEDERSGDPDEPDGDPGELIDEVSELAGKFGDALTSLWESPERKELGDDLKRGMKAADRKARELHDEVRGNEAVEELGQSAKKVAKDLNKGLVEGLRFLNRQLDGGRRDWREDRDAARDADDEVDELDE